MKQWIIILFLMAAMFSIVNAQGFGNCEFGNYPFGNCVIAPAAPTGGEGGGEGGGGGAGTQGFPTRPEDQNITRYDVSIEFDKSVYLFNETMEVTITIENKGKIPDEDTVLIYWITNPINRVFRETREPFFEVPQVGLNEDEVDETKIPKDCTYDTNDGVICKRLVHIPESGLRGEWGFKLQYFTSFQARIDASRPFTVKEELTLLDRLDLPEQKTLLGWGLVAVIVFMVIHFSARKDYLNFKKFKKEGFIKKKPPEDE